MKPISSKFFLIQFRSVSTLIQSVLLSLEYTNSVDTFFPSFIFLDRSPNQHIRYYFIIMGVFISIWRVLLTNRFRNFSPGRIPVNFISTLVQLLQQVA